LLAAAVSAPALTACSGPAMLRLCPKLPFAAVPEYVSEVRFSAPIALDAFAMTVLPSCAPVLMDMTVMSNAPTPSFLSIPASKSDKRETSDRKAGVY